MIIISKVYHSTGELLVITQTQCCKCPTYGHADPPPSEVVTLNSIANVWHDTQLMLATRILRVQ